MGLQVEFCGEWYDLDPSTPFQIGREGDLEVDDNPYLHRRFLTINHHDGLWWLENVGSRLSATGSDGERNVQAWLPPGARPPPVLAHTPVLLPAGPPPSQPRIAGDEPTFTSSVTERTQVGETTIGPVTFTDCQKLLILALAEPVLRGRGSTASIPTSADAAKRLGWSITRFNRKLDNVCEKLSRHGVRGLRGGQQQLAVNRRARLVEHSVASRLVVAADLELLEKNAEEVAAAAAAEAAMEKVD